MATESLQLQTVTGQKAQAEKKPYSTFVGVDVYKAGNGVADDLADAAAMRLSSRASANTPKV